MHNAVPGHGILRELDRNKYLNKANDDGKKKLPQDVYATFHFEATNYIVSPSLCRLGLHLSLNLTGCHKDYEPEATRARNSDPPVPDM